MRDQVAFLPKAKAGQVKLEIHLESQFDDSFRAEFKIGSKRMYVLKSVSKMTAAVKKYGNGQLRCTAFFFALYGCF
mgnify:CR=1 FL=1